MSNSRRNNKKRKHERLYTSDDSEYHNKTYCEFHDKKCITEVGRGEKTYLSSGSRQMKIDNRRQQMDQGVILELFMWGPGYDRNKGTRKLFIIIKIREGRIEGIEDKFNGNIFKLIRIQ